jgi:hypothetical protein
MSHVSSLDAGAQTVLDIELRLRSRYTRDKPPLKAKAPVRTRRGQNYPLHGQMWLALRI